MKSIVFICIENSNRSQIAQAFAYIYGKGKVEAYSAGSKPSGIVNEKAIETMKKIGYDLSIHKSKSIQEIPRKKYDYVITMGCGDECPYIDGIKHIEWNIPDPKELSSNEVDKIRNMIEEKVKEIIQSI